MALSQERYIDITSKIVATAVGARDFSGLVITDSEALSGAPSELKNPFEHGKVLRLSQGEVTELFGTDAASSKMVEYSNYYFSYLSPNGGIPKTLLVKKITHEKASGWLLAEYTDVLEQTDNFGAFAFLLEDWSDATVDELSNVSLYNSNLNFKHLFSVPVLEEDYTETFAEDFISKFKGNQGTVLTYGEPSASWMMMSWLAAINYTRRNGTSNTMYKQFSNIHSDVIVTTDTRANAFDKNSVNYIGSVDINGSTVSFYQRGFNSNGDDTAVYCNEMWFKAAIKEKFFNLVLEIEKIPANDAGLSMIQNIITSTCEEAINNGCIITNKTFTTTDKAIITQMAGGDTAAYDAVVNNGYWIHIEIQKGQQVSGGPMEYHAVYTLIYARGDAIRKVVGTNILV